MSSSLKLGFAGIGLMGKPMVTRLLNAGFDVYIWNRHAEKCATLQAQGAKLVATPARLAAQADVVMLCLADSTAVADVCLQANGIAAGAKARQVIIDFSSIDPQLTRELAAQMQQRCASVWLDIPVSGGVQGASDGSLVMMAGGDANALEQVQPILQVLAQRVTRMGDVGAGQVTKICNQMIVASNALVVAEVVALAQQAGVDASLLAPALAGGFADSKPFQILAPQMAEQVFQPIKWHVRTLLKDVELAANLAKSLQSAIPISSQTLQMLRIHANNGYAEQDPATLVKLYAKE